MDKNTVNLLLQLIALASKLAPVVMTQVQEIQAREGKTTEQIFEDAGIAIDANEAKGLAILASLIPTEPAPQS